MSDFYGNVVGISGNKSIAVVVSRRVVHPKYRKVVVIHKKYIVHDEECLCKIGDMVRFKTTRPISARKRWIVVR